MFSVQNAQYENVDPSGPPQANYYAQTPYVARPQVHRESYDDVSPSIPSLNDRGVSTVNAVPLPLGGPVTAPGHVHVANPINSKTELSSPTGVSEDNFPLSLPNTDNGDPVLAPTWHGYIHTTRDALIVLEACLQGKLAHIPRRPKDSEKPSLISSGSVFVYEQNASGMKRWTDGCSWSPSRIMGNFLVYREIIASFPPGGKGGKKAVKRPRLDEGYRRSDRDCSAMPHDDRRDSLTELEKLQAANLPSGMTTETARRFCGSLIDTYEFKTDGLLKKTITVEIRGVTHHVVCYYKLSDVLSGTLIRPRADRRLQNLRLPVTSKYSGTKWRDAGTDGGPNWDIEDDDPLGINTGPRHMMGAQHGIGYWHTQPVQYVPQFSNSIDMNFGGDSSYPQPQQMVYFGNGPAAYQPATTYSGQPQVAAAYTAQYRFQGTPHGAPHPTDALNNVPHPQVAVGVAPPPPSHFTQHPYQPVHYLRHY